MSIEGGNERRTNWMPPTACFSLSSSLISPKELKNLQKEERERKKLNQEVSHALGGSGRYSGINKGHFLTETYAWLKTFIHAKDVHKLLR